MKLMKTTYTTDAALIALDICPDCGACETLFTSKEKGYVVVSCTECNMIYQEKQ